MASQSQGIQQLLQAEKQAAEKVSEVRKRKNRRLKQAKEEAQAETEQYRLQREEEFKATEAAAPGPHGSGSTEVEKDTQEKMSLLQTYFRQNRDEVPDTFVCDIRPEIIENYHIRGWGKKKEAPVPWVGILEASMEYKAFAKLEL